MIIGTKMKKKNKDNFENSILASFQKHKMKELWDNPEDEEWENA